MDIDRDHPEAHDEACDCFSSFDLPDVGKNPEARSGANEFDFPQPEIPQEPGKGAGTGNMFAAFFHQPRRRG